MFAQIKSVTLICGVILLLHIKVFAQERAFLVKVKGEKGLENLKQTNFDILAKATFESGGIMAIITVDKKKVGDLSVLGKVTPFTIDYDKICTTKSSLIEATLIEYNTHITKFNVQYVPQLQKTHKDYLKKIEAQGMVLFEGYFDNDDGGFMLVLGEISDEVVYSDPTIQSGFIIPEISKVVLVREFSCE